MTDNYTQVSTPSTADVREYFAFGDFNTWDIHAWNERVPGRYELFDLWLAEHDRKIAEKAWAQGKVAGKSIAMRRMSDEPFAPEPKNPYRKAPNE